MQNNDFSDPDTIIENTETIETTNEMLVIQRIKNEVAIRLLQGWIADESGYDENTWERVKRTIEENRLSDRRRFDG